MSMFFPPDGEGADRASHADSSSGDSSGATGNAGAKHARWSAGPERRRHRRRRWILHSALLLALVLGVTSAAAAFYVHSVSASFSSNVRRESLLPPDSDPEKSADSTAPTETTPSKESSRHARKTAAQPVDYVLMGSDSRDPAHPGAGRSDTLMVLHLSGDRRSAYLISFPRDLWVDVPGHGKAKINAAYAWGGPQLTVRTLQQLLGTRMDHVAIIDFNGFIGLTEELGGVTVYNKTASSSGGYSFPVGSITVRGDQALAFVRERYDLPNGDLDRAERQRAVVLAILAKGLSPAMIADPARFTRFVGDVGRHVTVDDQLTDDAIRRTALSLRMTADDVQSLQAPISGFATVSGQSVDVVDQRRMDDLAAAIRSDSLAAYLERYPTR